MRQIDLIFGLFIAMTAGVAFVLGLRERRKLPEGVAAWFSWSIAITAFLFVSGAVMIFGALAQRDVELIRSVLLALMLAATLMMLIKQRRAK